MCGIFTHMTCLPVAASKFLSRDGTSTKGVVITCDWHRCEMAFAISVRSYSPDDVKYGSSTDDLAALILWTRAADDGSARKSEAYSWG